MVEMPLRVAALPRRGEIPIPWFVARREGQPVDFRLVGQEKVLAAINKRLCWICGQKLGKFMIFVAGPMVCSTGISAEPPMHRECAEYAIQACPFLTNPKREYRNEGKAEKGAIELSNMMTYNPGVVVEWTTQHYGVSKDVNNFIFHVGRPVGDVIWWTQGRHATREEALRGFELGLPEIRKRGYQLKIPTDEIEARIENGRSLLPEE